MDKPAANSATHIDDAAKDLSIKQRSHVWWIIKQPRYRKACMATMAKMGLPKKTIHN